MRGLIRPALFWLARIGLVLSIAAWIAGQWWTVAWTGPNSFVFKSNDLAWVAIDWWKSEPGDSWCRIEKRVDSFTYVSVVEQNRASLAGRTFQVFGVAGSICTLGSSLEIYHWLIVTNFALFYVVLKWVYRKREVSNE